MLYIILLFVFVVVYLMMLMRRQKEKMSEIKIQMLCCGRRNSVCRMWKMCKVLSGRLY